MLKLLLDIGECNENQTNVLRKANDIDDVRKVMVKAI